MFLLFTYKYYQWVESPISSFVREQIILEVSALSRNISIRGCDRFNILEEKVWAPRAVDRTIYRLCWSAADVQNLTHLLLVPGNKTSERKAIYPLDLGAFSRSWPQAAVRGRDLNGQMFLWQLNKFIFPWQSFLERFSYKVLNTLESLWCRTLKARIPKWPN